jgi:hypothetical protein
VCGVGVAESVTVKLMLKVPVVVGVPEICPVDALSVSPDGRGVDDVHEYGAFPPVAAKVCEYAAP